VSFENIKIDENVGSYRSNRQSEGRSSRTYQSNPNYYQPNQPVQISLDHDSNLLALR